MKISLFVLTVFSFFVTSNALAQQQVNLEVGGVIQTHCAFDEKLGQSDRGSALLSFSLNPDEPVGNIRASKMDIGLTCNAPFTLAVTSNHGGLTNANSDAKAIGGDFTKQIAYRATVNMTTDDANSPMLLACQSREMTSNKASCTTSSGSNAAIGRGAGIGEVAITLVEGGQSPIQGRYQDTIFLALTLQ